MYKFLLHSFRFFDFCTVKGCPCTSSIVVLCDRKPAGAVFPESFTALIDFCTVTCDSFDFDEDDYLVTHTYRFGELTVCVMWHAEYY